VLDNPLRKESKHFCHLALDVFDQKGLNHAIFSSCHDSFQSSVQILRKSAKGLFRNILFLNKIKGIELLML